MNLITNTTIYSTLFAGTIITLISSHWLLIWIGLEMSMFAIIPILINNKTPRATEAATKYFLVQATASMIMMMAIILTATYTGQWTMLQPYNKMISLALTTSLMMKLGLAPFHFWVPEVTQGVSLLSGMILLTWQKIAPISILFQTTMTIDQTLILSSAILSVLMGGWGGLNQTQLRKIMAYSSIAHMGWMTAILIYNPSIMILNLTTYIILTLSMFSLLMMNVSTTTSSLSLSWNLTPMITLIMLITLLSLGGLPPLTGFVPKWITIIELTKNNNIILPTFLAMTALLSLYFYMRLTYSTSLTLFPSTNNMKMKWMLQNKKNLILLPVLTTLSTLSLPLTPLVSNL
uniref:NADH-ubiquinone oxidoreductase chain 2 n=1 Tax=Trichys fasciculata TaxID=73865 RepID=A0A343CEG5_9HYST|nr:NADH dehydrogenase subunit 2 [Trichys fasciculata]ARM56458.1 NADH dehydrogenase subunit 2 [Trichys fasciculata]